MHEIKWSPYITTYPHVQIPLMSKKSEVRVVEPSTRASVKMSPLEPWHERLEKLRNAQRDAITLRYTRNGDRLLTSDIFGTQLIDFNIQ